MKPNRHLIAAVYMLALLLMLIPLSEAAMSIWPVRPGAAAWRFGAAGLISRALMTPLLGLMIASGTALVFGHRRMLRTLSVVAAIGAALLVAESALFALDAVELHARVRLDARPAFYTATLQALLKMVAAVVVTVLLTVGDWRASGRHEPRRAPVRTRAPAFSFLERSASAEQPHTS